MKNNAFVKGAVVLIIFNLIGKVLGAVYRIPLANILGTVGMGKYHLVFPLYTLILTISTSGVPVAVSKLVAEFNAQGRFCESRKVLKIAIGVLLVVSLIGSAVVVFGAKFFSNIQGNSDIYICFYAIAPAVLFSSVLSVFRGYFQGNLLMFPTAISGFVEQVVKMTLGLFLARRLSSFGGVYAVFGAVLGVSISEFFSFVFLFVFYLFYSRKHKGLNIQVEAGYRFLTKQLASMAAPITFSGMVSPLISMIDSLLVVNILMLLGFTNKNATMMLGIQAGIVEPLVNIPTILSISIATVLLPNISKKSSENSGEEVKNMVEKAIQISLSISLTFFICFLIFGRQILEFLYGARFTPDEVNLAVKLLFLGSVNIIFLSLIQVFSSTLNGLNQQKYVMKTTLVGCLIKIILDVALISISQINIMGAVISGGISYLIIMLLNYKKVRKLTGVKISNFYFYIAIQTSIVCVFAYFVNALIRMVLGDVVAMFLAGGMAGTVFLVTYYAFFIHSKNNEEDAVST